MYGVQIKGRKRIKDLMMMSGLNETTDQLAMASSVHWPLNVLRREKVICSGSRMIMS